MIEDEIMQKIKTEINSCPCMSKGTHRLHQYVPSLNLKVYMFDMYFNMRFVSGVRLGVL